MPQTKAKPNLHQLLLFHTSALTISLKTHGRDTVLPSNGSKFNQSSHTTAKKDHFKQNLFILFLCKSSKITESIQSSKLRAKREMPAIIKRNTYVNFTKAHFKHLGNFSEYENDQYGTNPIAQQKPRVYFLNENIHSLPRRSHSYLLHTQ